MTKIKWSLERRSLNTLTPYKDNPRIIKGKKLEDLKTSLSKFGLAEPIVINIDGTIIGGHGRYYALKAQGEEWADCYVPDITLDDKQVKELNIRLNKNIAGEWDFEVLANAFDTDELKQWGFEDHDFGQFDFGSKDEQGELDKSDAYMKTLTCPECGHTWDYEKTKKKE